MTGPFHPGKVYRVKVPPEHTVGHEMHDNEKGPRPWVVLYARPKQTGVVLAAPLGSTPVTHLPDCVLIQSGDWVDSQSPDSLTRDGWVHLHQARAIAVERMDLSTGPMAVLVPFAVERLRAHLNGMLAGNRMDRAAGRR